MSKTAHFTVRLDDALAMAVDEHSKKNRISRTESIERLIRTAFSNLERAEDLKRLVCRETERLFKQNEYATKYSFELLKNQAVIEVLLEKLLIKTGMGQNEIEQLKNSAKTKFIDVLKG